MAASLVACGEQPSTPPATTVAASITSGASSAELHAGPDTSVRARPVLPPLTQVIVKGALKVVVGEAQPVDLYNVLKTYAENEIKAAKAYEGHPILIAAWVEKVAMGEDGPVVSLFIPTSDVPDKINAGNMAQAQKSLEAKVKLLEIERTVEAEIFPYDSHLPRKHQVAAVVSEHFIEAASKGDIYYFGCRALEQVEQPYETKKKLVLRGCAMGSLTGLPIASDAELEAYASAHPSASAAAP